MKTDEPRLAVRFAKRLALLAGICLVLIACGGSGTAEPVATNSVSQAVPTPVPTTAPLSLPATDVGLPELAPLPALVSTNQAPTSASTNEVDSATPAAEAAAVPPVETPPETAAPVLAIASVDRWNDCLLVAADAAQSSTLLDPISVGTTTDMTSVQLNALGAASVECDMVANGLAATDIGDYIPTASACMNAWLESSGGGSVFVGLASIGWGQPVPAWAQPHFVDALDSCFTGASFAADVMSVVSADSSLTGAFDAPCLANSFDSSGALRSFAQALANDPVNAAIPVSLSDAWVLSCANVGQMVAVAAAAEGVGLSGATISCIDSELKDTGVVAGLIAGTADTDAVGIATIGCLTNAEATALLG